MKEQDGTSQTYPSMTDLVAFAKEGLIEDLLLGIARRQDEQERITHEQAVKSFEHKTDNPKASWAESENAGESLEPKPIYEEAVIKALINYCTEVRIKKIYEERRLDAPKGVN